VAHVVRGSVAAVPGSAQHPVLRTARYFHGAEADGQRYAVDRIADRATLPDGTLVVQVCWLGTPSPSGWTPRTLRTRRCASICAAPRAWGYPIRPPTRCRRPRVPRAPRLGPPQASLPRRPRLSAPDPLGRNGGRARTGGGRGGDFRWVPLGRSDWRSRGVDVTRQFHDDPHALSGHKEKARWEVDDVERVRYFTKHGVPRPAQARLISRRPLRPQRLPRHPQWPGPQGPHGTSQGRARTSGGRPQPHTQDAAPHTNLPRSSAPNGSPPKDLQTGTCSVTRQIQRLTTYPRASCPWGTAELHFTLPAVLQG